MRISRLTARMCMHMHVSMHAVMQHLVYAQRWQRAPLARAGGAKLARNRRHNAGQEVAPTRRNSEVSGGAPLKIHSRGR